MTSLFFGVLRDGTPADEKVVRATAVPYDVDKPAAMQDSMPDRGEVANDPDPNLGMVDRQKGSLWIQGIRNAPFWRKNVDSSMQHNLIVDQQVSTAGTAASREAQGEWGHPSASYAVGIEPVGDLTDGGKMGNEYFKAVDKEIQETADPTMMSVPPGYDQSVKGRVAAEGKVEARKAATAALYNAYWNSGQ